MPANSSTAALPQTLPQSFFEGLEDVKAPTPRGRPPPTTITSDLHQPDRGPNTHSPSKAMLWYDSIIDDLIANPGTTLKAAASRLGRSPVTIGYIVNSDLFKARYSQRRDQFNEELDTRLIGKLAKVAELSLDLTLESLEKKRTAVPLPLLHEVSDKALARLGYGPKQGTAAQIAVNVNQNNATAQVATPVSAEALAAARHTLKTVEQSRLLAARQIDHQELEAPLARTLDCPAADGGDEDGSKGDLGAL